MASTLRMLTTLLSGLSAYTANPNLVFLLLTEETDILLLALACGGEGSCSRYEEDDLLTTFLCFIMFCLV